MLILETVPRRIGRALAKLAVLTAGFACTGDSTPSTAVAPPTPPPVTPATAPNVIVILAEALGWSGTSVQLDAAVATSRHRFLSTPAIARLGAAGMRFSQFYAPSPRCTPSRAAFFVGRSPAQLKMTFVGESAEQAPPNAPLITPTAVEQLPTTLPTVASLLKSAGYATAHFGKWHVGRADPSLHGFDVSDGATANGGPDNVVHPNPVQAYGMTTRAMTFITQQVSAKRPFFVQLSQYAGKEILDVKPETWAAAKAQMPGQSDAAVGYAATTLEFDNTLALLWARLDSLGVTDNTYILLWSDHGPQGNTADLPLSLGKGTVWEGGVRVPLLVAGPGIPRGSSTAVRATGVDLLPTILDLVGKPVSGITGLEGGSLKSVLLGNGAGSVTRPRTDFVVHFPHYDFDPIGPASTIYVGNFKLIRAYTDGALRLFDLSTDLGERTDLSRTNPAKTAELDGLLSAYLTLQGAQMPTRRP
jgi:arylsulfatase A-like enzyme